MSLIARIPTAVRNAFLSPGARLFGLRFSIDYLRMALRVARRWGQTAPGEMQLLGFRMPYSNQGYAFVLLHELFVHTAYAFPRSTRPRIIDCGANIGWSVAFFKAYAPDATIVAIEPEPSTFGWLQRLVAINDMRDVELLQAAVAGREGTVTVYTAPNDLGSITTSIDPAWGGSQALPVRALRLSSLVDGPIDFVKIDVEGAEYEVVDDLAATGRLALIRGMVIECHDLEGRPGARAALVAQLERAGMRVTVEPAGAQVLVRAARPTIT